MALWLRRPNPNKYVTHGQLNKAITGAVATAKTNTTMAVSPIATDVSGVSARVAVLEGQVADLEKRVATLEMLIS